MKRIIYISRLSKPLSMDEIEKIGIHSSRNNEETGVTGLLVYFEQLFFQVIEGKDQIVDDLFKNISKDPRHKDILNLKTETNISKRLFPGWTMKTINLDTNVDELVRPIKILLQTVLESHKIIERYTSPAVLKILNKGINPLSVAPEPVERIILFADIVSYSTISERMSIEQVLLMLNSYFEICSQVIMDHGGEVNKFMGDGLMAYFDINQADHAIQSCLDILKKLEDLRLTSDEGSPLKLIQSGFGLSRGIVIEGNMGSDKKRDYTIIGDAVNTAARLEKMTREIGHSIVFSEKVKAGTKTSWPFLNLGKFYLKGKEQTSDLYTIRHELVGK